MTYSCAAIVHGIDLTAHRRSPFEPFEGIMGDLEMDGLVESSYNGMGETPYWIGPRLGSISSTSPSLEGCRLEPTRAEMAAFAEDRERLAAHLEASGDGEKARLARLVREAEPKTFLAWGSS